MISTYVPTGFGTIECACGTLPVPAPATAAILNNTGLPHYRSDVEQELLTPTGAAILAGIVDNFLDDTNFDINWKNADIIHIGRGVGKRNTGLPPMTMILTETK